MKKIELAVSFSYGKQVVNFLLRGWIKNLESKGSIALPLLEEPDNVLNGIFRELEFVREGSRRSVQVQFFGSKISVWNLIGSLPKSSAANLQSIPDSAAHHAF